MHKFIMPREISLLYYSDKSAKHNQKKKPDIDFVDFIKFLKTKKLSGRLLDIASEQGFEAVYAAKNGFNVTAVDNSFKMIKSAKELAKKSRAKISFIYSDFFIFAKKARTFDIIVDNNFSLTLTLSKLSLFFKELARLSDYDSWLYIKTESTLDSYCKEHCPVRKWTTINRKYIAFHTKKEIEQLLNKNSFKIEKYRLSKKEGGCYHVFYARFKIKKYLKIS